MSTIFQEAPPLSPEDQHLVDLYASGGRTLDAIPYTDDFESLYASYSQTASGTKHDVMQRLFNLRKAGRLPRLGRPNLATVEIVADDVALLEELIIDKIGSLGRRDQLVYTPLFDELADEFNRTRRTPLSHSDVWRLVARVAK